MKRLTCKTCEFKGTLGKLIKHYEKEPSHRPTGIRVVEGKKEEEGPLVAVRSFYATLGSYAFWAVVLGLAIALTCGR